MTTDLQRTALLSQLADLDRQISAYSQLYNSKVFDGIIHVVGRDTNTNAFFNHSLEIDATNDELRQFFNMRGATLICKRMQIKAALTALETPVNP